MMKSKLNQARALVRKIKESGKSIYDDIEVGGELWMPADLLEVLLQTEMQGHCFASAALRTRSKLAKSEVCRALGYPVPKSFRKLKDLARFPGQNLDTYVQAADNLQIWNAEVSPSRRYVLIRPDDGGTIQRVRVISGSDLAPLDRTGKLTRKYQARADGASETRLASRNDTPNLAGLLAKRRVPVSTESPIDVPDHGILMPIKDLFAKLSPLVGTTFENPGILQERNRGGALHRLIARSLGYSSHADNGRFPDIRHQLLEVKLQTSSTIDLGAISPDDNDRLEFATSGGVPLHHRDVRYAIFFGIVAGDYVTLTGLSLVTGNDFFSVFEKFGGLVINNKYQLPLPRGFFDRNTEGIFD